MPSPSGYRSPGAGSPGSRTSPAAAKSPFTQRRGAGKSTAAAKKPDPKEPPPAQRLCVGTYNVRVDHPEDYGTVHEWSQRRHLVAEAIRGSAADLIALQEPSPPQADDLTAELGDDWGVLAQCCDPQAWANAGPDGPSAGPERDGNGVAWRKSRLQLLDTANFWLCPNPEAPATAPAWGGSQFQRTCFVAKFRDKLTGQTIGLYSAQLDHESDDSLSTGGSEARRQSANLIMSRANEAKRTGDIDLAVVGGVFNTFEDRNGAAYAALQTSAEGQLNDVRDVAATELDCGRGDGSWEGWETDPWSRAAVGGSQRYDQLFVTSGVQVAKTGVLEGRFVVNWQGEATWVYASDHAPIVADLVLATKTNAPGSRKGACLGVLFAIVAGLAIALIILLYESWGGKYIQCRFDCRDTRYSQPWDLPAPVVNHTCPPSGD